MYIITLSHFLLNRYPFGGNNAEFILNQSYTCQTAASFRICCSSSLFLPCVQLLFSVGFRRVLFESRSFSLRHYSITHISDNGFIPFKLSQHNTLTVLMFSHSGICNSITLILSSHICLSEQIPIIRLLSS